MAGQAQNNTVVDVNFQRYCNCMYVVCQRAMCRVFLYLYHHHQQDPSLCVREVLAGIPSALNRLGASQRATLARREIPAHMDITLLYILLQQTCGLQPDADRYSVWNNPTTQAQTQSLEHKLYQIKKLRNDLSHEPGTYMRLTNQQLKEKVEHLEHLCCDVVREAADRTGHSPDSINTVTTGISAGLQLILTSTHSNDFHPQEWATLAREEQRTNLTHHQLPSAELLYKTPQKDWDTGSPENVLSLLDKLLPRLILLTGQAGTGKTTLCQQAWESWVDGGSADSECDLVLRVPCDLVTTCDVARIVKEKLLPNICQTCDYSQVLKLLGSLRVMWLLDGMEDAGPEALRLLRDIISSFSDKHVILVTCQPKYAQEFINLAGSVDVYEIQLDGLSNEGAQTLAKHMLTDEDYPRFKSDVKCLGNEVDKELNNPLRLTLAAKLWQEGTLSIEPGVSLSHLYAAVEAALMEKVSVTLANKRAIETNEAKSRVHDWLKELYKVAFEMTIQNRLIVLDESATESLEKKLQRLLPSYTECFSTFLTCMPDTSSSGGCYSFIHMTQQRYLAAQHLCQILLSDANPGEVFKQTLQLNHADPNKLSQLYEVILQVLSILAAQNKLEGNLEEILINTLGHFDKFDWLEVVQCSGHSESVTKRASQHMPDSWTVTDNYLHAATIILKHTNPTIKYKLLISIQGNPKEVSFIKPFLMQVANSSSIVFITFWSCSIVAKNNSNAYCDEYWKLLCNKKATCTVKVFNGPRKELEVKERIIFSVKHALGISSYVKPPTMRLGQSHMSSLAAVVLNPLYQILNVAKCKSALR